MTTPTEPATTDYRNAYIKLGETPGGADILARAGTLPSVVEHEQGRAATSEPATDQLDTILTALETDLATMPREDARTELFRRMDGLLNNGPASNFITLVVDALTALADERAAHAQTAASFEDYAEVAEDWQTTLNRYEREDKFKIVHACGDEDPYLACGECEDFAYYIDDGCTLGHLHAMAGEHLETDHDNADDAWAALDQVLTPIVVGELARQAADQDPHPAYDLQVARSPDMSDLDMYLRCPECEDMVTHLDDGDALTDVLARAREHHERYHQGDTCDTCGGTGEIHEEGQPTGVHGWLAPCPDCRQPRERREFDATQTATA
jgi:hypothetical protein